MEKNDVLSINEFAKAAGVTPNAILYRIKRGDLALKTKTIIIKGIERSQLEGLDVLRGDKTKRRKPAKRKRPE